MDPKDHRHALPDGLDCSVCEERIPGDRIRLLARRDGLSFVQSECPACGSTILGFITRDGHPDGDVADPLTRRPSAADAAGPPITADDVLEMHRFLDAWDGDLAELVGRDRRGGWRER
jgi:hypothetical protein